MKNYTELFNACIYGFHSKNNVLEERDLGICADIASIRTPEYSVAAAECFQGCPFSNTGFRFDIRTDGEKVRAESWEWLPNAMYRHGSTDSFKMDTLTAVIPGMRTVVLKVVYTNKLKADRVVPLQVMYRGCTQKVDLWDFSGPPAEKGRLEDYAATERILSAEAGGAAFRLTASLQNMKMFKTAYLWENEITIPADGSLTIYFSMHMGSAEQSMGEAVYASDKYEELIEASFKWLLKETARIHGNLPRLSTDAPELDTLYYRSLVTYILCRWENPDLCMIPYFSTGSINGACMCSYLWDYSGGLMLHPLYDPEGNKKQLKAYLKNDLTESYALNPVTGGAIGSWYQINQEKIILMVYYHVLLTGEKEFLFEKVGDKTVLELMRYHAYVCDDVTKEVELYDYGEGGNAHLELRRSCFTMGLCLT